MYCTLPNGSPRGPNYPSAHSGEGMGSESRWKVQTAVYFDDLPLGAGGLHLWPGSHARVWEAYRELKQSGSGENYDGYNHPVVGEIKADTEPVDTHGPAGSVVLWHSIMLHMAGVNMSSDIIRQATLYAFAKTPESMPDDRVVNETLDDIWRTGRTRYGRWRSKGSAFDGALESQAACSLGHRRSPHPGPLPVGEGGRMAVGFPLG